MCDKAGCVRVWEQLRRAGVVTITAVLSQVILINMESLGVVTINISLVTEGGGVPLKQLPDSILETMRKSSGPHCLH